MVISSSAPSTSQEALGTWPPTLREHLDSARETFGANPQLSVVLQELSLHAYRDEATRAAFDRLFRTWNALVALILREEIERGTRPPDLDPELGAFLVTSYIMGAMMQLGVSPGLVDFDALSRELERRLV